MNEYDKMVDDILNQRYYKTKSDGTKETWEDLCERVSKIYPPIKEYLLRKEFIPNSPCLMNAPDGMMSACFVLPVEDSLDKIFDTVKDTALIHKEGGGTGFNFSNLRPEGSKVKTTNGVASGPVSFMKVFNATTEVIKQGGRRRGANMGILNQDHPDIKKFLTMKSKEGEMANFNISILIKDINNIDDEVKQLIIDGIYNNGEPGVLFYDNINKRRNKVLEPLEACNPCFSGDTMLLTDQGYVPIDTVIDKEIKVWNGVEFVSVTPYKTSDKSPIYRIEFSNGTHVDCTSYHKWYTLDGVKQTKDLIPGEDRLIKSKLPIIEGSIDMPDAYDRGFYCGDGSDNADGTKQILVYPPKAICYNVDIPSCGVKKISVPKDYDKFFVPSCKYTYESRLRWLSGLVDADGSLNHNRNVRLYSSNKDFLLKVMRMLQEMGVHSSIGINSAGGFKKVNKSKDYYYCKPGYVLFISRELPTLYTRRIKYVGGEEFNERMKYPLVVSVTEYYEGPTYCLTEPYRHQVIVNGVPSSQCGERMMIPYDSCTLGSIDISKFVDTNSPVGYNKVRLTACIKHAVRFLDSVIDRQSYVTPKIKETTKEYRNIGLGIMGYHDYLILNGMSYNHLFDDTDRAWVQRSKIQDLIVTFWSTATWESHAIGLEWACAPIYDKHPELKPRRSNYEVTCIAPTGTISMIAGCSSGIEPNFSYKLTRNTLDTSYEVELPILKKVKEKNIPEDLLECSRDIDPKVQIDHISLWQDYIDSGISKTINLPHDIPKEKIWEYILYAHEKGCKGLTFYREGSRDNAVLVDEKSMKENKIKSPKPIIKFDMESPNQKDVHPLDGVTYYATSGCCHLYVTVNYYKGKPWEVFIQSSGGGCSSNINALSRTISLALQQGVSPERISKSLHKTICTACVRNKNAEGNSCGDIIGKLITNTVTNEKNEGGWIISQSTVEPQIDPHVDLPTCPECGAPLTHFEGCVRCTRCTYNRCG